MRFRSKLTLAALAMFGVAACGDSTSGKMGSVSVMLTDAPGDVLQAVVTISSVYLQGGEGDDPNTGGRVMLREDDFTVDLLTLAASTADLVEGVEVPEGTYRQLRFVVTGAFVEVENSDGTTSIYASSPR